VLKCPTLLRFPSPVHFISNGIPSSLKASFESSKARELLHGIRAGSFDNDGPFSPVVEHEFAKDTVLK